ncbi:ABC transporter ATP-binding protein [soil metagenome]
MSAQTPSATDTKEDFVKNPAPTGAATGPIRGSHLKVENLTKEYGDSVALAGVSLDVLPGEFMTLLGPSGSGKTTTLNIVSGFTEASSGALFLDGARIDEVPARKRGIGMVFQNYALFPHMTVAQNIAFPLKQRRIGAADRKARVDQAIATVRLEGLGERYPSELSGGQQQRVALARAIVFEPGLLLMDEPLGALDRGLRESMQLEIRRIHREAGSTVVFVTHDQEEALALSDRIAVFNEGHIEQVGSGADLYLHPATLFVARFLGESTVITGADGQLVVVRPERAQLVVGKNAVAAGRSSLDATVVEEVYLGHDRKVRVRLPNGEIGIVRESAGAMSDLRIGDVAQFTWSAADQVTFPAAG